jgi:hypothetical protein
MFDTFDCGLGRWVKRAVVLRSLEHPHRRRTSAFARPRGCEFCEIEVLEVAVEGVGAMCASNHYRITIGCMCYTRSGRLLCISMQHLSAGPVRLHSLKPN